MHQPAAGQNLLFGITGLRMDFIAREVLIAARNAWLLEKASFVGEVRREQGALAQDDRQLLESLDRKHLGKHGEDAGRSLSALTQPRVPLRRVPPVSLL